MSETTIYVSADAIAGPVPADAADGPGAPGTISPPGGVLVPEYCLTGSVSTEGPTPATDISLSDGATPEFYPAGASVSHFAGGVLSFGDPPVGDAVCATAPPPAGCVPPAEYCPDGVLSHSDGVLSIGELVGDGITCDFQANIQSVTSATVPHGKVTYNNQLILPDWWCPTVIGVVGTGLHPNPDVAGWDPFQHFSDSPVTVGASIGLYSNCDDVGCDLYLPVSGGVPGLDPPGLDPPGVLDPPGSDPPAAGFLPPKSGSSGMDPPVDPLDVVFLPGGLDPAAGGLDEDACHSTPVGITTIPGEDPPHP
jgi:hypothetical protein